MDLSGRISETYKSWGKSLDHNRMVVRKMISGQIFYASRAEKLANNRGRRKPCVNENGKVTVTGISHNK